MVSELLGDLTHSQICHLLMQDLNFQGNNAELRRETRRLTWASDCPEFLLWLLGAEMPGRVQATLIGFDVASNAFLHCGSLLTSIHSFCLQDCSPCGGGAAPE